VISFDIGGCKDVVGEYGKLIKYGDINSFIYEIIHFNFNSFKRAEISEKTLKKFDVDVMKNNYMSLYDEVLRNE
jgi:glycosyltransferase involved in cell wall biosynthesis